MARNRGDIKVLIRSHTGRTKETLENAACNSALKLALLKHPFNDAISTPSDIALTEDATSVDISSASAFDIVTARIVEADGSRNTPLKIKNRTWWDSHVVNAEDNTKGWPVYALRTGTTVHFDRPLQSGLELRLRITTEQTFTDDNTTCPIACLDIFVEKFVTSEVFFDVGNEIRGVFYKVQALGPLYDKGEIGGVLKDAIQHDLIEIAEELKMEGRGEAMPNLGLAVLNDISWHDRYGETDVWF